MPNQDNAAGCCDPAPMIDQCYTAPKTCASLTNWASSLLGCGGDIVIQANLSSKKTLGSCSSVTIKDVTPIPSPSGTLCPRFSLTFKFGCVTHSVTFCNLPNTIAEWSSFIYTVLATDAVLLQNNVKIVITNASITAKEITLQICVDCPGLAVAMSALGVVGPVTVTTTPVALTDSAPKLGQFVAYAYTSAALTGLKTYDATLPYAGFLRLPANLPLDACCLPTACDCSSIAGCQIIQRTGKITLPLALPFPTPSATLVLATKPTGEIAVFAGALASGYVAFPYPYSFFLDPSTVGSTLISIVLH